ncbi:integrase catalytic domain-containing protein [Trichonephila clavipes]|nr:integrase catalytic domain-containing protein [Trichonephila clavipes]
MRQLPLYDGSLEAGLGYWARTRDKASHGPIPIPLGYRGHENRMETGNVKYFRTPTSEKGLVLRVDQRKDKNLPIQIMKDLFDETVDRDLQDFYIIATDASKNEKITSIAAVFEVSGVDLAEPLKSAIKAHENDTWSEIVPIILLGIRTAIKDLQSSCAEIAYSTNLRLPIDMIDMSNIPFLWQ